MIYHSDICCKADVIPVTITKFLFMILFSGYNELTEWRIRSFCEWNIRTIGRSDGYSSINQQWDKLHTLLYNVKTIPRYIYRDILQSTDYTECTEVQPCSHNYKNWNISYLAKWCVVLWVVRTSINDWNCMLSVLSSFNSVFAWILTLQLSYNIQSYVL